jgi:hypothetical protein
MPKDPEKATGQDRAAEVHARNEERKAQHDIEHPPGEDDGEAVEDGGTLEGGGTPTA